MVVLLFPEHRRYNLLHTAELPEHLGSEGAERVERAEAGGLDARVLHVGDHRHHDLMHRSDRIVTKECV